jgi:hypothetical protein
VNLSISVRRKDEVMRARTATIGDLEAVFGHLSQRLGQDYASSGVGAEAVRDALVMNLKEGRAHALLDGDLPLAIIAWHERDGRIHTLFAAQETFFRSSSVRFCKQHIKRIQALGGNLPVQHKSWIPGPQVVRWFGLIGFAPQQGGTQTTVFELAPAVL